MRPLTLLRPKPLVEIAGRPIIDHICEALPEEVSEIVVVVKYLGNMVREHLGSSFRGRPIVYVEQGLPDGTGGALFSAREHLRERFLVMPTDDLHGHNALKELIRAPLGLLAALSDTPERFGVLVRHTDGTLLRIHEKPEHPPSKLVNTSVMVLDRRVFNYTAPLHEGELYLTDLVTQLAGDVPIEIVEQPHWCPLGRPEDIPIAERVRASWLIA